MVILRKTKNTPKLRFREFTDEWQVKKLGELLTIGSGRDYKHLKPGDIPVYGTGGLMLHVNDYLYDGKSIGIGRKGTIDKPQFLQGKFWTVDTLFYTHGYKQSSPEFLYAIFQNINWQQWNEASGVPSLSKTTIEKIKVIVPREEEQEKIAEFLRVVDERVEGLQKKVELLEKYKKGAMQAIFSQKIRFKDENGKNYPDWEERKLGDVFDERSERGGTIENMLSVTINNGIVPFSTIDRKDNSSVNKDNYKRVEIDDVAYNSMRMWQGASGVSVYAGIVSPAYTVLKPKSGQLSMFYGYYFKLPRLINMFERYSQGLTSDTWNLKYPQLAKIKIKLPQKEEQQKIADFLTSIDDKIKLVEKELEQAKKYKQSLLQRMFV